MDLPLLASVQNGRDQRPRRKAAIISRDCISKFFQNKRDKKQRKRRRPLSAKNKRVILSSSSTDTITSVPDRDVELVTTYGTLFSCSSGSESATKPQEEMRTVDTIVVPQDPSRSSESESATNSQEEKTTIVVSEGTSESESTTKSLEQRTTIVVPESTESTTKSKTKPQSLEERTTVETIVVPADTLRLMLDKTRLPDREDDDTTLGLFRKDERTILHDIGCEYSLEYELEEFLMNLPITPELSNLFESRTDDLSSRHRQILLDWLVEVAIKFKLHPEVMLDTINLVDQFLLTKQKHLTTKFQLLGVCAMSLMSKFHEMYAPEVRDFVYICDRAYTVAEINDFEYKLLNALSWKTVYQDAAKWLYAFGLWKPEFKEIYSVSRAILAHLHTMGLFSAAHPRQLAVASLEAARIITIMQGKPGKTSEAGAGAGAGIERPAPEQATAPKVSKHLDLRESTCELCDQIIDTLRKNSSSSSTLIFRRNLYHCERLFWISLRTPVSDFQGFFSKVFSSESQKEKGVQ
jgi:hypothetical protein